MSTSSGSAEISNQDPFRDQIDLDGYDEELESELMENQDPESDSMDEDDESVENPAEEEQSNTSDGLQEIESPKEIEPPKMDEEAQELDNNNSEEDKNGEKTIVDQDKEEDLLELPPHGTQVFVANLPWESTEEELQNLCEESGCGALVDISVKRNADTGRAEHAFLTFEGKEIADQAIEYLNGRELKDRKLRVSQFQNKNRLFLGNIPSHCSEEEVAKLVSEQAPGFQRLELVKDLVDPSRNRGFAFVEYYNQACAEKAMKNMARSKFKVDDRAINVEWASGRQQHGSGSGSVKRVHVSNLPEDVTEDQLREIFGRHGHITEVVIIRNRNFGFVEFAEPEGAMRAVERSEKHVLEGNALSASLAKRLIERKPRFPPHQRMLNARFHSFQRPNVPPNYGHGYGYPSASVNPGEAMVAVRLPDGNVGYILQQGQPMNPVGVGAPAAYRAHGSSSTSYSREALERSGIRSSRRREAEEYDRSARHRYGGGARHRGGRERRSRSSSERDRSARSHRHRP